MSTTQKGHQTEQKEYQRSYLRSQWGMFFVSIGIAVAASWNLVILNKTFKEAYRAANSARDTARAAIKANKLTQQANLITQSAFVYVGQIGTTGEPPKGVKVPKINFGQLIVALTIETKNSGPTPARNTRLQNTYCVHTGSGVPDLPKDFSFPENNSFETPHMMPPGADFTSWRKITEAELEKARSTQNTILYIWGTVLYDDIFHRNHKTEFCMYYRGALLIPKTGELIPQFSFCNRHNCDDDDCPESWGTNDYDCGPAKK